MHTIIDRYFTRECIKLGHTAKNLARLFFKCFTPGLKTQAGSKTEENFLNLTLNANFKFFKNYCERGFRYHIANKKVKNKGEYM